MREKDFLGTTSAYRQAQYDDSKKPAENAGIGVCSPQNTSQSLDDRQIYFFTIPGEPVAMGRHRTTRTGHTYTPKKTVDAKSIIAYTVSQTYKGLPLDKPLRLSVRFCCAPSKAIQKKQPLELMAEAIPVIKRPDIDNLLKTLGDALNGILWTDDKLIVDIEAVKRYSLQPRISFSVEVL